MSQVVEYVLLANEVVPVDKNGFKPLDKKTTGESLEFYKTLAKAHLLVICTGNKHEKFILPEKLP